MVKIKKYTISLILISSVLFTDKSSSGQTTYIPRYNTIAHKMLHIEDSLKLDFPGYKIFPDYKTLDALIDNSKTYITKKQKYSQEDIKKIIEKIYTDMMNKIPEVKNRKKICYETSLIYLAIGESNNLPFYGVTIPGNFKGHIFIRYDPDGKHDVLNQENIVNKGDFNIATASGEIRKDRDYFRSIISKKAIEKGIYLKNLNEKELLSISYWDRAGKKIKEKNYKNALKDCEKAIQLNPNSVQAYQVKGIIFSSKENSGKDYNKAIENYTKAIELNPEPELYNEKASLLYDLGKYKESIENYTTAIGKTRELGKENDYLQGLTLKCLEIHYLNERAIVFNKINDFEKSKRDTLKAKELKKLLDEGDLSWWFLRSKN